MPFFITELAMYSSLLAPLPKSIRTASVVNVVTRPIDVLLSDLGIDPSRVDLLVLDTRARNIVLSGASTALPHANAVVVEMPKNCATRVRRPRPRLTRSSSATACADQPMK